MLCSKCGIELPDDATFCGSCGAPVEAETPVVVEEPVVEEVVETVETEETAETEKPKKKGKLGGIIGIVAAILACVMLFTCVAGVAAVRSTPRSVVKRYAKASISGDYKDTFKLEVGKSKKYFEKESVGDDKQEYFEDAKEECEEEGVFTIGIFTFNQYYRAVKKLTKAALKEEFGSFRRIKIKVTEVEKMDALRLASIKNRYESERYEGYVNPNRIRKGKTVKFTYTIKGTEDEYTGKGTIHLVKYKGRWRVAG